MGRRRSPTWSTARLRRCAPRGSCVAPWGDPDNRSRRRREVQLGGGSSGVRRQPDDPVGHRGDDEGHGDATAVGGDLDGIAVEDADLGSRCGRKPCDRHVGGAGEVRLTLLEGPQVEEQPPRREDGLTLGRGCRCAGRTRSVPRRARPPRVRPRPARGVRRRASASWIPEPSSSASMLRTRASLSAWDARAASKGRSRPSQSRKVPAFSATGATGKTTSACSVTADGRSSRLTTNAA